MPVTDRLQGYMEGYYGNLLEWPQRLRILDALQRLQLNTYCYAPKEDPLHRINWRLPYAQAWRSEFRHFCQQAAQRNLMVIAGIAPGLDFDFGKFPGCDFDTLTAKAQQLKDDGAERIMLLMDDIDTEFHQRRGAFQHEGTAHAALANALADSLGEPVLVVPRVYADELAGGADQVQMTNLAVAGSPRYLKDFTSQLRPSNPLLYCGKHIVARSPTPSDIQALAGQQPHRVIIWDNLYANDYCPRCLFTGPWELRTQCQEILLNPTGMIETDLLLLEIMSQSIIDQHHGIATDQSMTSRAKALQRHQIPDCFSCVEHYFWLPHFNDSGGIQSSRAEDDSTDNKALYRYSEESFAKKNGSEKITGNAASSDYCAQVRALDFLLWQWKTPLAREWYPFLLGLKQDLSLQHETMQVERVYKSYSHPLATTIVAARSGN